MNKDSASCANERSLKDVGQETHIGNFENISYYAVAGDAKRWISENLRYLREKNINSFPLPRNTQCFPLFSFNHFGNKNDLANMIGIMPELPQ